MATKTVRCSYSGCGNRRIHHDRPDVMRPHRTFEVPSDVEGPCYCSIECQAYDGSLKLTPAPPIPLDVRLRMRVIGLRQKHAGLTPLVDEKGLIKDLEEAAKIVEEGQLLATKLQMAVNHMGANGLLEDGVFTFPDGDEWEVTR